MAIELKNVAKALISGSRIHKKAMEQIPGGQEAVVAALKAEGFDISLDSSGHFVAKAAAKADAKS